MKAQQYEERFRALWDWFISDRNRLEGALLANLTELAAEMRRNGIIVPQSDVSREETYQEIFDERYDDAKDYIHGTMNDLDVSVRILDGVFERERESSLEDLMA